MTWVGAPNEVGRFMNCYPDELDVEMVAQRAGVSKYHFIRGFSAEPGQTSAISPREAKVIPDRIARPITPPRVKTRYSGVPRRPGSRSARTRAHALASDGRSTYDTAREAQ
jgi:hypothetical protein